MRPASLAQVAALAAANPACLEFVLAGFADAFYAADRAGRQASLDPVPSPSGDAFVDAYVHAVGEHLARRWGLDVPPWTARPLGHALDGPRFVPDEPNMRGVLLVESPSAFRSRMLFVVAEPLRRARFPRGARPASVPLAWPDRAAG